MDLEVTPESPFPFGNLSDISCQNGNGEFLPNEIWTWQEFNYLQCRHIAMQTFVLI